MILANQAAGGVAGMVLWIVILIAFMYFFMIRPQNKKQKETEKMLSALKKGDKVSLVVFGTFEVRTRSARTGINPATKEKITIPAKKVVKFKAGAELAAKVK